MDNDYQTILRSNYSDIIYIKNGYEQINFELFLNRHLKIDLKFINNGSTSKKLKDKFSFEYADIKKTYFKNHGTRQTVSFHKLSFYQFDVGISGPFHHDLNDPVFIVKDGKDCILWEGYHRTLIKILNKDFFLDSYVVTL